MTNQDYMQEEIDRLNEELNKEFDERRKMSLDEFLFRNLWVYDLNGKQVLDLLDAQNGQF